MAKIDLFLARCHSPEAMPTARSPLETMAKMARETAVRHGRVPRELGGLKVEPGFRIIAGGQFLLRCDSGYGYHYVPGEGITIERPDAADPDEEVLWLNGSVYAAVACLNGLYPIHASAVAAGGRVFAFTGPPGAGKSTLVTGLGQRGLPMPGPRRKPATRICATPCAKRRRISPSPCPRVSTPASATAGAAFRAANASG